MQVCGSELGRTRLDVRELLSLEYPRALTARGRRPASAGNAAAAITAIQKSAMFTQMRAETRSVASLPFAFRSTHADIYYVPI